MTLPLDFHPAVRREVDLSYRYYVQAQSGLGRDFLRSVEKTLTKIGENPERYGFAEGDIHEAMLKRFPFAIYFRVLTDRIRVLAIFHTSRDPSEWTSRN